MSTISIQFGDLVEATFLERPNRFIVLCCLVEQNQVVEAHLADPGRLKELLLPGARLYLRHSNQPHRKTKWSVVLVEASDGLTLVSVQSTLVNQLTALALEKDGLPELGAWNLVRPEYSYDGSRWDFLLENSQAEQLLLEVKSCSLVHDGVAMFPDAVTERGKRHVQELTRLHAEGVFSTAVLFVIQRSDAHIFRPADHIDPAFGQALRAANLEGVQVLVRDTVVSTTGIDWGRALPVKFP